MMRGVRSRLWSRVEEKMYLPGDDWAICLNGQLYDLYEEEYEGSSFFDSQFIVMLSTGLNDLTTWEELSEDEKQAWLSKGSSKQDWKGKEIFAGDIVRDEQNRIYELKYFPQVGWRLFGETVSNPIWGGEWFTWVFPKMYLRKIGNVHENPELLGGGQ